MKPATRLKKVKPPTAVERTVPLFDVGPELPAPDLEQEFSDGTTLRIVRWDSEKRPCIVRTGPGDKTLKSVERLVTICGSTCEGITSTSKKSPPSGQFCQTCLAGVGRGALG